MLSFCFKSIIEKRVLRSRHFEVIMAQPRAGNSKSISQGRRTISVANCLVVQCCCIVAILLYSGSLVATQFAWYLLKYTVLLRSCKLRWLHQDKATFRRESLGITGEFLQHEIHPHNKEIAEFNSTVFSQQAVFHGTFPEIVSSRYAILTTSRHVAKKNTLHAQRLIYCQDNFNFRRNLIA